jgi:hypothetical protein
LPRVHPLPGNDPSEVPEIRDWIVQNLQFGRNLRCAMDDLEVAALSRGRMSNTSADVELWGLERAKLFWIPRDEQTIIVGAKQTLPDGLTLTEDDVPYPSGFAVFEEAFLGTDAETGAPMPIGIKAFRWSPFKVLDSERTDLGWAMSMSSWTHDKGAWFPMGRFDWLFGQEWREYFADYPQNEANLRSLIEDRARFMALWALMNTQEPLIYRPTRAEIRRDARIAPRTEDRLVHVVKWDPRRYSQGVDNSVDSHTGRHVTVRFPVEGFWRHQACGPRLSKRKWTYVPPHFRGPIDAPLKAHATTVHKVATKGK